VYPVIYDLFTTLNDDELENLLWLSDAQIALFLEPERPRIRMWLDYLETLLDPRKGGFAQEIERHHTEMASVFARLWNEYKELHSEITYRLDLSHSPFEDLDDAEPLMQALLGAGETRLEVVRRLGELNPKGRIESERVIAYAKELIPFIRRVRAMIKSWWPKLRELLLLYGNKYHSWGRLMPPWLSNLLARRRRARLWVVPFRLHEDRPVVDCFAQVLWNKPLPPWVVIFRWDLVKGAVLAMGIETPGANRLKELLGSGIMVRSISESELIEGFRHGELHSFAEPSYRKAAWWQGYLDECEKSAIELYERLSSELDGIESETLSRKVWESIVAKILAWGCE